MIVPRGRSAEALAPLPVRALFSSSARSLSQTDPKRAGPTRKKSRSSGDESDVAARLARSMLLWTASATWRHPSAPA